VDRGGLDVDGHGSPIGIGEKVARDGEHQGAGEVAPRQRARDDRPSEKKEGEDRKRSIRSWVGARVADHGSVSIAVAAPDSLPKPVGGVIVLLG
jgi:hypothetical protein